MNSIFPSSDREGPVDSKRRYQNPTFGLSIWGPFVPASDCRECLYALTGIQTLCGLMLWWVPWMRSSGTSRWMKWFRRAAGAAAGSYVMMLSGLEIIRLQLPNDPWADDAARARNTAEARGEKVSRWFGPAGYRPVEFKEWKRRIDARLAQGDRAHTRVETVRSVYTEIQEKNRSIAKEILTDLQRNKRFPVREEFEEDEEKYRQANQALLRDLKDEEIEWDALDPWDQLHEETDIMVRLLPHSRGVLEEALEKGDPRAEFDIAAKTED
ncbi:hypothetical protein TRVA0_022S00232 [Trichomonascus vanleenenianus]|uniref:Mgr1p n=1 Tax=Trichomonascus vanleenenianus TaxID=2268995 RepID=UPI003EC9D21F